MKRRKRGTGEVGRGWGKSSSYKLEVQATKAVEGSRSEDHILENVSEDEDGISRRPGNPR